MPDQDESDDNVIDITQVPRTDEESDKERDDFIKLLRETKKD